MQEERKSTNQDPKIASMLQSKMYIIADTSVTVPNEISTTAKALVKTILWETLKENLSLSIKSCLHCSSTTGGI